MSVYIYTHTRGDVCVPNICALSPHNICGTKPPERAHLCTLAHRAGGGRSCLCQRHRTPPWHRPPALPVGFWPCTALAHAWLPPLSPQTPSVRRVFFQQALFLAGLLGMGLSWCPWDAQMPTPTYLGLVLLWVLGQNQLEKGLSGSSVVPFAL